MSRSDQPETLWVDDEAGPVVRPYAMTRGRATTKSPINVIALVRATELPPPLRVSMVPEHISIIDLCRERPLAMVEVAAHLNLPLGTVRVLLDDLLAQRLVQVTEPASTTLPDDDVFEALINGLRAL
ncbi:DUF742 domain-containing protein (plasmid) [Micromonospora zamorensis]|uniref:DUF742 domain-containing protein n=1 Tax=Micromonospora zamorensis TaxID=709883 RepID=UPI002E237D75